MTILIILAGIILLICGIGILTSKRELQVNDNVSLKKDLHNKEYTFKRGSILKVTHVIYPYGNDCVHLKDENNRELLFVDVKYLIYIKK